MSGRAERAEARGTVPPLLAVAAAWSWRLIAVAAAVVGVVWLLDRLFLLVVPFIAGILITALLHPVVAFLRRRRLPRAVATWTTILLAFAVLGGIGLFVVDQVSSQYDQLVTQVGDATDKVRDFLVNGPLNLDASRVDNLQSDLLDQLNSHRATIASGALSAGRAVVEVVTGLVLCFFITFFLLYDGEKIWGWLVELLPRRAVAPARGAGRRAWTTLSGYVHGTVLIAVFQGIVVGAALVILGVPLVVPLALLVFLGSFIPIIGAVLFGGFAVVVALLTQGWVVAVILVGVLVVANQVEAHLLQPFVVGRYVRLHPLAIAVSLTAGALLGGIVGAIIAVPLVATVNAAGKYLSGREDLDGNDLRKRGGGGPSAPAAPQQVARRHDDLEATPDSAGSEEVMTTSVKVEAS